MRPAFRTSKTRRMYFASVGPIWEVINRLETSRTWLLCHCGLPVGSFALAVAIATEPFIPAFRKATLSMFSIFGSEINRVVTPS